MTTTQIIMMTLMLISTKEERPLRKGKAWLLSLSSTEWVLNHRRNRFTVLRDCVMVKWSLAYSILLLVRTETLSILKPLHRLIPTTLHPCPWNTKSEWISNTFHRIAILWRTMTTMTSQCSTSQHKASLLFATNQVSTAKILSSLTINSLRSISLTTIRTNMETMTNTWRCLINHANRTRTATISHWCLDQMTTLLSTCLCSSLRTNTHEINCSIGTVAKTSTLPRTEQITMTTILRQVITDG